MDRFISKLSKEQLRRAGFSCAASFDNEAIYECEFPCYWYRRKIPVLEAHVSVIMPSGRVSVMVYSGGEVYPPYMLRDNAHEPINAILDRNIGRMLKNLGMISKDKARKGVYGKNRDSKV